MSNMLSRFLRGGRKPAVDLLMPLPRAPTPVKGPNASNRGVSPVVRRWPRRGSLPSPARRHGTFGRRWAIGTISFIYFIIIILTLLLLLLINNHYYILIYYYFFIIFYFYYYYNFFLLLFILFYLLLYYYHHIDIVVNQSINYNQSIINYSTTNYNKT